MTIRWLPGLAALSLSLPALAQNQPAATPREPRPDEPAWATRCLASERGGALTCVMEQRVLNQGGQVIAAVIVRVVGDSPEPALTMQLPLGIDLAQGVRLTIDQGSQAQIPVRTCESSGCYAEIPLPKETLDRLKAGQTLTMGLKPMEGEAVTLPFTLSGFTAAYNRIAAPAPAQPAPAQPAAAPAAPPAAQPAPAPAPAPAATPASP